MTRKRSSTKKKKTQEKEDTKPVAAATDKSKKKKSSTDDKQTTINPSLSQSITSSFSLLESQQHQPEETTSAEFFDADKLAVKSSAELLKNVKELSEALRKMKQVNSPSEVPWNDDFVTALADKRLLSSKEKDIQAHVALCIAEVMRIIAPEPCYPHNDQRRVFKFFIEQLRDIQYTDDALYTQRFRLLERLATVKMFVLLTDPDLDAADLVESLFTTFFASVSEQQNLAPKAVSYMGDILVSVLESSDVVSDPSISTLLAPLLPKSDDDNLAFSLSKQVLEHAAEHLATPITEYLKSQLTSMEKSKKNPDAYAKKRSTVFKTILQLNLITPRVLLYIIPQVAGDMKDANVEVRSGVVQLFGNMFSARESTMAKDYKQLFEEFLTRFTDADARIRIYMTKFAAQMLLNHHSTATEINARLEERAMDQDEKVRRNVVETACAVATKNPTLVSEKLMQTVAERCRDKKYEMRMHALKLIADLYRHHAENVLNTSVDATWPDDLRQKLAWIPSTILMKYFEHNTVSDRTYVESLLDSNLLPEEANLRTAVFIDMFSRFGQNEKNALNAICQHKLAFRTVLQHFLNDKEEPMEEEEEENEESKKKDALPPAISGHIQSLINFLPESKNARKVWRTIYQNRTGPLASLLRDCLEHVSTTKQLLDIRKKFETAVKSESKENAEYLRLAVDRAVMNLFCRQHVEKIFGHVKQSLENENTVLAASSVQALEIISRSFPALFGSSWPVLGDLIAESSNHEVLQVALKILFQSGKDLEVDDHDTTDKLRSVLFRLCESGSAKEAKYAAAAISRIFIVPSSAYSELLAKIFKKLAYGPNVLAILSSLCMIAKHSPREFKKYESKALTFAFDEVLGKQRGDTSISWNAASVETKAKVSAMKLLFPILVYNVEDGYSPECDKLIKRVLDFLYDVVNKKGDIHESADDDVDEDDRTALTDADKQQLRLAAATTYLSITNSKVRKDQSMERLQTLANVTMDPSAEVRIRFARKLHAKLVGLDWHLKYLAFLVLGVADPAPANAHTIRNFVSAVIKRFRNINAGERSLNDQQSVAYMPEYVLPYIIYLIAHRPDFDSEQPLMNKYQKMIFAYFDEVTSGADNIAFFQKLLYKIREAKDATDETNFNFRIIADLCFHTAPRTVEGKNSLVSTYPGVVLVPNFFKSDENRRMSNAEALKVNYLPEEFKFQDKAARKYAVEESPVKKSPAKKPAASTKKKTGVKRKRKSKKESDESTATTTSPRTKLKRSAKNQAKYEEEEEEAEEEQDDEDEEMEDAKDDGEAQEQQDDEEADEEPPAKKAKTSPAKKLDFDEPETSTVATPSKKRKRVKL